MKKRCNRIIKNIIIAVFCTFTAFSHCLFGYASNDDEYITFNSAEMMQAYRYFYLYGLRADSSYTYTDTYTTHGTTSESASITLSSNGGFSASGTDETEVHGGINFFPTDDATYTLDISTGKVAHLDPTSTDPSHLTLACTYSTPTDLAPAPSDYDYEYKKMSCSDPAFVDVSRYDVTLYQANDVVTIEGRNATNFAHFVDASEGAGDEFASVLWLEGKSSFSGSLSLNSNGSLSGTGTFSATTTTTNTNSLSFVLPWMSGTINDNQLSNPAAYIYLRNNDPFVIAFISKNPIWTPLNFKTHIYNSSELLDASEIWKSIRGNNGYNVYVGGFYEYVLESKTSNINGEYFGKAFLNNYSNYITSDIIPLYVGYKSFMSDGMYRYLYGSDRIEQAIKDLKSITQVGTLESKQKGQTLDNKTNQMQTQMTTFQNIEDTAGDNMNAALQNINTNPSLISNNKFLMSVDWIRQQYNRLVTNTPFEAVITFCLVFGLGLLLLGKVR